MTESEAHFPPSLADLQQLVMGSTLVKCAAADLGIQWAGWALAAAFKTEKFYDLAGNVGRTRARARKRVVWRRCTAVFGVKSRKKKKKWHWVMGQSTERLQ